MNASSTLRLIEFECRGQRIALPLACVRRVIPSAEPAPLPGAGDIVLGALNVAGELVGLVDPCRRLGLPAAPMLPSQQVLLVELSGLPVGLLVDRVFGVVERAGATLVPDKLACAPFVAGMVRLDDGLCLLVDPQSFLFPHESEALSAALLEVADARA
jgi:chemotaxis signal transduction protein